MIPGPRRSNIAATAAIGAVLLAGVPTAIVVLRGRAAKSAELPRVRRRLPRRRPSAVAPASADGVPAATVVASSRDSQSAAAAPKKGETPALRTDAAAASMTPADAAAARGAALPIVTFGRMKLLATDGGKSRDRDTSLRLGAEQIDVLENGKAIESAAYRDLIGVFHSHSREPRWTTPDGTAVPVAKTGGKFGFFKGVPDWITLRTRQAFIPLRVQEEDLARVIAELEIRTGSKIVRTR